jgi:hypothetical protein
VIEGRFLEIGAGAFCRSLRNITIEGGAFKNYQSSLKT